MEVQFTRRDFLKGSIVVALGAAGATALSSCASGSTPTQSDTSAGGASASDAEKTVTLHRGYGAAHGDKCFTSVVVATADDGTILGANLDDYQFMAADTKGVVGVPNSTAGFAAGCAPGQVLISKTQNNDLYSENMKEKGNATKPWLDSVHAIEGFCVGKKASDLKSVGMDAVSGATLVDAPNYLKLIAEVAGKDDFTATGSYKGDGTDLKFGRNIGAAHGDKGFAEAVSLVQGDTLVATSIDEFQFMASTTSGLVPVPNSDKGFGKGYASGQALISKSVNSDLYSENMKEKAKSTTPWIKSISAIEASVAGKSIDDAAAEKPDAISGATLVDAAGYVKVAVAAAKAA